MDAECLINYMFNYVSFSVNKLQQKKLQLHVV